MDNNNTDNLLVEIRDTLHRIEQLMLQQVEKQVKAEQLAKWLEHTSFRHMMSGEHTVGKYRVVHSPIKEGTSQDDNPNRDPT